MFIFMYISFLTIKFTWPNCIERQKVLSLLNFNITFTKRFIWPHFSSYSFIITQKFFQIIERQRFLSLLNFNITFTRRFIWPHFSSFSFIITQKFFQTIEIQRFLSLL